MSRLEKTTYFFLIVLCVVSLAVLLRRGFFREGTNSTGLDEFASRLVGQTESGVSPDIWKGSRRNVVILLSSHCHFCAESIPLYQRLSILRRKPGAGLSLLAVGREGPADLRDYLNRNSVAVDDVLQVKSGFAGVGFTPAVFVVDSKGVVERAFLGRLDRAHEATLLSLLGQ